MSNASHEGRHRVSQSELTPSITSKVIVSLVYQGRWFLSRRTCRDFLGGHAGVSLLAMTTVDRLAGRP